MQNLDDLSRFTRIDASRQTLPTDLADHAAARWEAGLDAAVEWYERRFSAAGSRLPDEAFAPLVMADLARLDSDLQAARLANLRRAFPGRLADLEAVAALAAALTEADSEPLPRPLQQADTLGKYTLKRPLGEGAFGQVWLAWDNELSRHIALKVLHYERDTAAPLLTEARASAAIDHPAIAKVYAVGAAVPTGQTDPRTFIDMQLVADATGASEPSEKHVGASLQSLARPLSPKEAAQTAVIIARALAAAHACGIVHGDMKPGNVLRTPAGRIMLVDFGLARRSVDTPASGRITGTPAYLAPEQTHGAAPTPASDIYAAGATLRFLLTGKPLYEPTRTGSVSESRMDIIDQVRANPPGDWGRPVPRALRRIAERAAARSVSDRYTSADQLAADLDAWLAHRPVLADPPSPTGRVALWYRRNAVAATIAAAALITLAVVSVRFVHLLQRERDDAVTARAEADTQATQARAAAELAQKKTREAENAAATAEATSQFMERMLVAAMPQSGGREVKVIDAVNRAVEFIPKWVGEKPEVEANVRAAIGKVYMTLGDWNSSLPQLEQAVAIRRKTFGADHPLTIKVELTRAQLGLFRGENADSEPALRSLLARSASASGDDDEVTLAIEALLARSLRYTRPQENLALARDVYERRARTLGDAHQDTVESKAEVARALGVSGDYDGAIAMTREVLAWREREQGYDNHFTLVARSDLGALYLKINNLDSAEQLLREVVTTRISTLGPAHPNTLAPVQLLAFLLGDARHDNDQAISVIEPSAKALLAADKSQSTNGVITCRYYAELLRRAGRTDESRDVAERTLPAARRVLRPNHDELRRLESLSTGATPP